MLWFIGKMTIRTCSVVLFIWNVAVVVIAVTGLPSLSAAVLDISDVLQFLDHLNRFQLYFAVNQRWTRDIKNYSNILMEQHLLHSLLLSSGEGPVIFNLYSNNLLVFVFS